MLECKICKGNVVWCGSEEHHKHTGDEVHECHQLVCLNCNAIYDLGYTKSVLEIVSDDSDSVMTREREVIVDLYLNGLK